MAVKNLFPIFVLSIACLTTMANIATATRSNMMNMKPGYNLAARLEASGGLMECWNALMELKSCTNEILVFFLNGQSDIGPDCCRAIDVITHNCWPAMLTALGFTAEEGNLLRGYCDAASSRPPPDGGDSPSYAPSPGSLSVIHKP